MRKKRFWTVWSERGGIPRTAYMDHGQAKLAADRLARENPGYAVYVMEAREAVQAPKPELERVTYTA